MEERDKSEEMEGRERSKEKVLHSWAVRTADSKEHQLVVLAGQLKPLARQVLADCRIDLIH